uniref:Uncharacterized protein n=1 Tax=Avena sativa TaxID=4498 RepID=A0ACD5YTR5_AVESA
MQPEDNCSISQVPAAEPEEERLPEGNAEADAEMCGGLDEQEKQQRQQHPASVLMELEQAKSNLCRTTSDLAAIRASIESLRTEIASEKMLVERRREKVSSDATVVSSLEEELDQATRRLQTLKNLQRRREDPSDIFLEIKKMTSEIEQLRNAANASKSEAMMLAAEIEETKAAIGTAEVRCLAAKKMEEAARAAEALAVAEIKALLSSEASAEGLHGTDGVVDLSVEEYFELASKAREADESSRNRIAAAMVHVDEANQSRSESLRRLEEAQLEVEECKNALQEALKRVETANRGKFAVEETIRRWRSENVHKRRSLRGSPRFKHAAPRQKDSHCMDIVDVSSNSLKPTLSIGQILSMKLMGPDGYDKSVSDDTSETSNVSSLGQILNRKQAFLYSGDTSASKKFSGKRKKFAFTGLSVFLAKQAKSKKKRGSD